MPPTDYKVEFPDIREALYIGKSFNEIRNLYIDTLKSTGSLHNISYANKLENCKDMMCIKNLNELESDLHAFKEHMRKWAKENKTRLIFQRRQKDFLGLNEKIRLYLKDGKSPDNIWDLVGFRIILGTDKNETIENINLCYEVLNEVIRFFTVNRHCSFLQAEPTINTKSFVEKNVIIPKKSLVLEGYENNVKDYILTPKENGYQSLHVIIRNPNGLIFEVQIRTFAMDLLAEYGSANHFKYKKSRYWCTEGSEIPEFLNDCVNIDFGKINIPGFAVLENGEIHDLVGLTNSIDPLNFLG